MEHEDRLKAALAARYQIEREIGSGGMATVYLAQDLKYRRQVAVKVLDPDLTQGLAGKRFLRETGIVAELTHPHILPTFDVDEADGFFYFVMPYVEGGSLRSRLEKEKQLPVEEAVRITREIADALAYAHGIGLVHRDVKPGNIMLEAGHAVLADFGIAQVVGQTGEDRLTRTGTSLGTPAYMSPEQATGEGFLDGRSDQYALGCVLFEMLAGHPPFTGVQTDAVIRQHLTEKPPSVTRSRPSVTKAVAKVINRALAKSPADRFRTTGEMAAALALTTAPEKAERKTERKFLPIILGVVLLAVIGLLGTMVLWSGEEPSNGAIATGEDQRPSIAVLPFDNFSPDPEDAYFADGMQEQITSTLAKIGSLIIRGRTSVMSYRDHPRPLPEVASELGVTFILEGSTRVAGDRVRMTAQLIDAEKDEHVWSQEYDRAFSLESLLDVQSEIAQQVASELRAVLTPDERSRIQAKPTDDLEAYRAYLSGRYLWGQRTPEGLRRAITLFEEAIGRDSAFALAYSGLADAYVVLPWYSTTASPQSMFLRGEEAALNAIRLDPTSSEAHASLGYLRALARHDLTGAEEELMRAIALDPTYPTARHWLADVLSFQGRLDEAIGAEETAHELDPLAMTSRRNLGNLHMFNGEYEEALRFYESALDLGPNNAATWERMALVNTLVGRFDAASDALARWGQLTDVDPRITDEVASALLGFRQSRVPGGIPTSFDTIPAMSPFEQAGFLALAGETDRALDRLEIGVTEGWPAALEIRVHPVFDPLRDHPRFQALLQKMNFSENPDGD